VLVGGVVEKHPTSEPSIKVPLVGERAIDRGIMRIVPPRQLKPVSEKGTSREMGDEGHASREELGLRWS
jgi:hypothetical protein